MSIQVCELLLVETSDTDNDADGMELQFSKRVISSTWKDVIH